MKELNHSSFMTVLEASKELWVSRSLLYRWIKQGRLPYHQYKPHGQIFLKWKHVKEIANSLPFFPDFTSGADSSKQIKRFGFQENDI